MHTMPFLKLKSILLLSILALQSGHLAAQDKEGRYLVLSTNRTKTLRAELDAALANGYGVVAGEPASDILILQKNSAATQRTYRIVDTLYGTVTKGNYTGFRILPWSFSMSQGLKSELAAVLESLKDGEPQPEYKLPITVFTRNLQKDIAQASAGGYRAIAMTGLEIQSALLQKMPETSEGSTYQLLATKKISTMQKEIGGAADQGFRVVAATGAGKEILVLLEKSASSQTGRDYKVISTTRTSTFEKEINDAAQTGYRLVPQTGAALVKGALGMTTGYEQAIIMEKQPSAVPVRYMLLGAKRERTLERELNATPESCRIDSMFLSYEEAIVLLACPQ